MDFKRSTKILVADTPVVPPTLGAVWELHFSSDAAEVEFPDEQEESAAMHQKCNAISGTVFKISWLKVSEVNVCITTPLSKNNCPHIQLNCNRWNNLLDNAT
jgi:hypothetical protein